MGHSYAVEKLAMKVKNSEFLKTISVNHVLFSLSGPYLTAKFTNVLTSGFKIWIKMHLLLHVKKIAKMVDHAKMVFVYVQVASRASIARMKLNNHPKWAGSMWYLSC